MNQSILKRIAVATNDNIKVAGHVGRCNAFIVFEVENNKVLNKVVRINSFTNHKNHDHMQNDEHQHNGEGHGNGHHNIVNGLSDCEALIFNHGGWRLIEDLKSNNITPVLTNESFADAAVQKYLDGTLTISEENVCQGHHH